MKKTENNYKNIYILQTGDKVKINNKQCELFNNAIVGTNSELESKKINIQGRAYTFNREIEEIVDFYWCLYQAKMKERPILDMPKIRNSLKKLLVTPQHEEFYTTNILMVKSCINPFLELDDDFTRKRGYPLELLPYKLAECRTSIKENLGYFKGTETEYYQDYINDVIRTHNLQLKHNGEYRQKNSIA